MLDEGSLDGSFDDEDDKGDILDYASEKVLEMRENHGPFPYRKDTNSKLETRTMATLENGAKYLGEWNKRENKREGRGIQVWADGSMYEGYWKDDK